MVLADSHRISRVPWYSGYFQEFQDFRLPDFHLLWLTFPDHSTNLKICNSLVHCKSTRKSHNTSNAKIAVLNTLHGLGFFRFARRYSGNHCCFLFLKVLRCFSSLRYPKPAYIFSRLFLDFTRERLSDSEIPGFETVTV